MNLTLRFDYGSSVPWVTRLPDDNGIQAVAGPNLVVLRTSVALQGGNLSIGADFEIAKGERVPFVLTYGPSHRSPPLAVDANAALDQTLAYWSEWSARCSYKGQRREAVIRSLLTLKALTFAETGGKGYSWHAVSGLRTCAKCRDELWKQTPFSIDHWAYAMILVF
jgi:GH15 family glucan-1,4-alpha-glucosidase